MKAIVTKATGSWYRVENLEDGKIIECRIRGKMRMEGIRTTNPVTVGDIVEWIPEDINGVITSIESRKNYVIRKATNLSKEAHIIAANVSMAYLVATVDMPVTSTEFIDRFLLGCELYKVPVTIVLNKMDLFSSPEFREYVNDFKKIYIDAGYTVLEVSAREGDGVDDLRNKMRGQISLFSGNSGVGKSTLINAIAPNLELRCGEISDYHHKGKHTTTFSEMFKLEENTYLIDSPGIKGFGLLNVSKEELARYMPDLFAFSSDCGFYNCTHIHEPKCNVKLAVQNGELSEERYQSYLKMVADLEQTKYR